MLREDYNYRLFRAENVLNRMLAKRDILEGNIHEAQEKMDVSLNRLKAIEAAIPVMQSVAGHLQSNVKDKIVSIVQTALQDTFPEYIFTMEFVTRRDKTECDMYVTDLNGNRQSILDGCGGGLKDIISFALRVAIWSLDKGSSPVILLDEPFKFLSEGMRTKGAHLLEVLSRDLNIQFLTVSHVDEIIDCGTRVYTIRKNADGISSAIKSY